MYSVLISRFILETKKDVRLIKMFENGIWYPNFDEYRMFLHKQERNNNSFSKLIKHYRLVRKNDLLVETVYSKDIKNVSTYLEREAIMIETGYGVIKVDNCDGNVLELAPFSCDVSNGFFDRTKELALKQVNRGSCIIGVCDNEESEFYKENISQMKELEKVLHKKHVPYKKYQHVNHRDKCVLLSYRASSL